MTRMVWANAVVQGVLLGGLYALFAAGLSLMFGVLRIVNLAHGDLSVVAAFAALVVVDALGVSPFLTLLAVVPALAVGGYVLQRFLLTPAIGRGPLTPLLVTFGLSIVLQNALQELFSADTRGLRIGSFGTQSLRLSDDLAIGWFPLLAFGAGAGAIGGLHLFLRRTAFGRLIRATSDDPETVGLMGVDHRRVYATATAIALAMVAVAGVLLAMRTTFNPSIGPTRLIFAFEAVIIGGLGSLWGTLVGGVVLGVAQTVGAQVDPGYGILTGHLVFLAMLAFRPQGLLPSAVPR
jgi:branched-chain amino acid transport system permease protein